MSCITLNGLIGSNPLGALASFGLLRLMSSVDSRVKLSFQLRDDWIACIQSGAVPTEKQLIEKLIAWAGSDELTQAIDWAEDVRVEPDAYRTLLHEAISRKQWSRVDALSSLVADGVVDAQKGLVKPSAFYMVSGQQSFLGGMREIRAQAQQAPEKVFREALLGPWQYRVRAHSLGWDPNTERLYALRSRAPTSEKPSCVAGAMLLGLWALPLMPALSREGRPYTTGFSRHGREQQFSWPIFSTPIEVGELQTVLQVGREAWWRSDKQLRTGIATVFESARFEFGQGYAVLRPARAIARDS